NTQHNSSGYLTLALNSFGSYSGKLLLNGKSHVLHGTLAPDGTGVHAIIRPGTNPLTAYLSLDLTNQTDRLDGYISEEGTGGTVWTAELVLDRATYSRTNPAPNPGKFTLFILP